MVNANYIGIRQVELIHINPGIKRILKQTLAVEREATAFLCDVAFNHWKELESLNQRDLLLYMEKLVHKTKANPEPLYPDFDKKFKKFPSYLRRAAIMAATGAVSSYQTRLADYDCRKHDAMSNGRKFKEQPPKFAASNTSLSLYKGVMFQQTESVVKIKVYIRNTWDWITVAIDQRDYKDLQQVSAKARTVCCPSIVYKYHKFYLAFPIEYIGCKFPDTTLDKQSVLAVDLGINHGAVCSVMNCKGQVSARAFDPFKRERNSLDRYLQLIRDVQKRSGVNQSISRVYQKLEGIKDNYTKQLAHWIVEQAKKHGVYGIVIEHLGKMKAKGSRKDRIHHWCKKRLISLLKGMAFRSGIRVFEINPRNTSKLAFDGSGEVVRDKDNFSQCTFATGKRYACDLSASYNIGARYFLRALEKSMLSETWGQLKAKVPELSMRTQCTMATLWKVSTLVDFSLLFPQETLSNVA